MYSPSLLLSWLRANWSSAALACSVLLVTLGLSNFLAAWLERARGDRIESAVKAVLAAGLRTGDIWSEGTRRVGTRDMGDAVLAALTGKTITKS